SRAVYMIADNIWMLLSSAIMLLRNANRHGRASCYSPLGLHGRYRDFPPFVRGRDRSSRRRGAPMTDGGELPGVGGRSAGQSAARLTVRRETARGRRRARPPDPPDVPAAAAPPAVTHPRR